MKFSTSEHNQGINTVPMDIRNEIEDAIGIITTQPIKGASSSIRREFLDRLKVLGWPGQLGIAQDSAMTITSQKGKVGLCLQVGNVARSYADMMKLQTLYMDNVIIAAVIIVPSTVSAGMLGGNLAQGDRLLRELNIFSKVYTVPTIIFELGDI